MEDAIDRALGPIADELLSLVADGVVSTDSSGSIILMNKAAEEIFGYDADELLGEKVEILMPQRYRVSHQTEVQKFGSEPSKSKREMAHGRDVVGLKKTGEEFPIEASLTCHKLVGRQVLTVVLRDISERRQSEEARRLVVSEMSHRIKNLMAVVSSIVSLTARGAESVDSYAKLLRDRLRAVGRTVDLMLPTQWSGANLTELLEAELSPFMSRGRDNFLFSGPEVKVPARRAMSLTLAFHELATNAAKYGALSTPSGIVKIEWALHELAAGSVLRLEWLESGGPIVDPGTRQGFGSDLISRALGRSNTRLTYHRSGLEAHIQVAL